MSYATAQCLCGKIGISAPNLGESVGACHCVMCRTWSGGPLLAVDGGEGLILENEAHISVYSSSEWAERGFCNVCGTHLFYRLKDNDKYYIPVGLFADSDKFHFDSQIYVEQKPHYYDFANKTRMMTGDEVVSEYEDQGPEKSPDDLKNYP